MLVDMAWHKEFIALHKDTIPTNYFDQLEYLIDTGRSLELLECLGRYGDHTVHTLPIPKDDETADMTFAGVQSEMLKFINRKYITEDKVVSF
jgi:hypothetical protein